MLIISQRAWNATDTEALAAYVESAMKLVRRRQLDPKAEPLLLLPQAVPADDAPERDTLLAALGDIAASEKVMLAGAAGVAGGDGVATVGFLLSAEGEPLLTAPKISPDLVTGFGADATAATGQPAEFKVASTGIGQVGILPGEDVLFAHYARARLPGPAPRSSSTRWPRSAITCSSRAATPAGPAPGKTHRTWPSPGPWAGRRTGRPAPA